MEILNKIKSLNLPTSDFVVMGSAILEVKGIRKAEDIDIIVSKKLFDKLKESDKWEFKVKQGSLGDVEVESLANNDGVTLYHYIYGGGEIDYFFSDPTTEKIEGIWFASLENLLKVKSTCWDRPKDRADVKLIEAYLSKTKK